MKIQRISDTLVQFNSYEGDGCKEFFFTIQPINYKDIKEQIKDIFFTYQYFIKSIDLNEETEISLKIYVSDSYNYSEFIRKSFSNNSPSNTLTIIQIPPCDPSIKVILFSYHIKNNDYTKKSLLINNYAKALKVVNRDSAKIWISGLTVEDNCNIDSYIQTSQIFKKLDIFMNENNLNISNLVRTWFYVNDIENHYDGMVKARREFLKEQLDKLNLNRYMASTGIGGRVENSHRIICMDAIFYKYPNMLIKTMQAPGLMNHPYEYGVTFERGLEISFSNRKHLFISGTASIDEDGDVLYSQDINLQVDRTIQNIIGLLTNHNHDIIDLKYIIVYIRNFHDYQQIKQKIDNTFNNSIIIYLTASICRPAWLIEIECFGISPYNNISLSPF